jgi:hypothetical protein
LGRLPTAATRRPAVRALGPLRIAAVRERQLCGRPVTDFHRRSGRPIATGNQHTRRARSCGLHALRYIRAGPEAECRERPPWSRLLRPSNGVPVDVSPEPDRLFAKRCWWSDYRRGGTTCFVNLLAGSDSGLKPVCLALRHLAPPRDVPSKQRTSAPSRHRHDSSEYRHDNIDDTLGRQATPPALTPECARSGPGSCAPSPAHRRVPRR